jgi:hypothetical protein
MFLSGTPLMPLGKLGYADEDTLLLAKHWGDA